MENQIRANLHPGLAVDIIQKKDQRTGKLTRGIIKNILTSAPRHTRGIKVRLEDGTVGRVHKIIEDKEDM
ncbi:MAG: YwbE family protein [Cytophagaceae bacterium]|nr:YwbE family protein [Cytophagaceae bacterium]